ncbi:MAG: hypothetical protein AAB922_04760 [Patescibacteria group bacterium]
MTLKEIVTDTLTAIILASLILIILAWSAGVEDKRIIETREEQARITERLDDLDSRLKATDKTIVEHWRQYGKEGKNGFKPVL